MSRHLTETPNLTFEPATVVRRMGKRAGRKDRKRRKYTIAYKIIH